MNTPNEVAGAAPTLQGTLGHSFELMDSLVNEVNDLAIRCRNAVVGQNANVVSEPPTAQEQKESISEGVLGEAISRVRNYNKILENTRDELSYLLSQTDINS